MSRIRMSLPSVRSILRRRDRLRILHRLRRLLLRYGTCRFKSENRWLSALLTCRLCCLLRLYRLLWLCYRHGRFRSEKASFGGFFCTSAIFASMSFCLSGTARTFACLSHVRASE